MRERLKKVICKIFSAGILCLLGSGVIISVFYFIAFIFGGEIAENIVQIVNIHVFPVMFVLNILLCVIGIVYTYLVKDQAFRFKIK